MIWSDDLIRWFDQMIWSDDLIRWFRCCRSIFCNCSVGDWLLVLIFVAALNFWFIAPQLSTSDSQEEEPIVTRPSRQRQHAFARAIYEVLEGRSVEWDVQNVRHEFKSYISLQRKSQFFIIHEFSWICLLKFSRIQSDFIIPYTASVRNWLYAFLCYNNSMGSFAFRGMGIHQCPLFARKQSAMVIGKKIGKHGLVSPLWKHW